MTSWNMSLRETSLSCENEKVQMFISAFGHCFPLRDRLDVAAGVVFCNRCVIDNDVVDRVMHSPSDLKDSI